MHRVKVEAGSQQALVHVQRPRARCWEGPSPARGMPLNLPFPRPTAGHLDQGDILNHLKSSQEEHNHNRSLYGAWISGPSCLHYLCLLVSFSQGCMAWHLYTSWGQETIPSALPSCAT